MRRYEVEEKKEKKGGGRRFEMGWDGLGCNSSFNFVEYE